MIRSVIPSSLHHTTLRSVVALLAVAACGKSAPVDTVPPGVIFSFPADQQIDVPLGARIVVVFSDPIDASALGTCTSSGGAFCLVGPDGAVNATPTANSDGHSIQFEGAALSPSTVYSLYVGQALCPTATNLPAQGPLLTFTTRGERPRAAPPTLVAVNGGPPTQPDAFRPLFDTSTIRLVFSEPLDPRSVVYGPGSVQLVDASGSAVPAMMVAHGIHISIDPTNDLTPGTYMLQLGSQLVDLGGQPLAPITIPLVPHDSKGSIGLTSSALRTRQMGDPGESQPRTGTTPNIVAMSSPLIGQVTSTVQPSTLASQFGDPTAAPDLNNAVAFRIPRGQRLNLSGLAIALGGQIPSGLTTGDVSIELLTDADGRLYRNPYHDPSQAPDNDRSPLYVDLDMDVAIYASDPVGNAVLTQTVLGVQSVGMATPTDGVLDIESVAAMDLGLLGVAKAPSNLVLEAITDANATVAPAATAPTLIASYPAGSSSVMAVDSGIELIFSEPVDYTLASTGGVTLQDSKGSAVPAVIESAGAALVVRPLAPLAYSTQYQVDFSGVVSQPAATDTLTFSTPTLVATAVPTTLAAVHGGAPCALTGATAQSAGRCLGGLASDDLYHPFALVADEPFDVSFTQPLNQNQVALGSACGSGDVRVEQIDGSGSCTAAVPGTLLLRDRSLSFVPDTPWTPGAAYRMTLVSGASTACTAGDLCGMQSAASFDALDGTTSAGAGGPDAVFPFAGAAPNGTTYMVASPQPFTDVNASGFVETGEVPQDANRAAVRIIGTGGVVTSASFGGSNCVPGATDIEPCIYVLGSLPAEMQPLQPNCTLPDGTTAPSCVPLTMTTGAMYGTSITLKATVLGLAPLTNDTGTTLLRVREPANGPPTGYIIDDNGTPTLVAQLSLYMDAPDLKLPLGATHDLHSKPLTVSVRGPVTFLPDGRIAISLVSTADSDVTVNISALGLGGSVTMRIGAGQMKLQLVSPLLRGGPPS
jgi:hypothetical protein